MKRFAKIALSLSLIVGMLSNGGVALANSQGIKGFSSSICTSNYNTGTLKRNTGSEWGWSFVVLDKCSYADSSTGFCYMKAVSGNGALMAAQQTVYQKSASRPNAFFDMGSNTTATYMGMNVRNKYSSSTTKYNMNTNGTFQGETH